MRKHNVSQSGFTIVELMIATTVLSVILLIATLVMTNIGKLYSKGINQSNIQDSARNIVDDVSQNLELNKTYTGPITNADGSITYCIASTRYTLVIGKQLSSINDSTHSKHVLWRDAVVGSACDNSGVDLSNDPASTALGATELVPSNSRLSQFSISANTTPPYSVTIGVVYGDADLLCDLGTSGDCASSSASTHVWNPTSPSGVVTCKEGVGSQYCAVSNLTTTVVPRLYDQ